MVRKNSLSANGLSPAEHERVAAAMRRAEAKTSGEVYAVLAAESDDYFYPACFAMSLVTLVLAIVCAFWLHWSWRDVPLHTFGFGMLAFYALSLFYLLFVPSLRLWLTPAYVKRQRCHLNAMRQFLAHNVHRTANRTAVLLFVSLAERYAEVIADAGMDEKVAQGEWQEIVGILTDGARRDMLADGYIRAIGKAGEVLKRHFPATPGDGNVLPDRLVEL